MAHATYDYLYGKRTLATGDDFKASRPIGRTVTPIVKKNAADELAEFFSGVIAGQIFNVPFGPSLANLTSLTNGLLPGSIMTVCGDPGIGKTYLVLQMLRYWHSIGMEAVVYFVEEDRRFHVHRLIAQLEQRPDFINLDWIKAHPETIQAAMTARSETLNELGRCIWSETADRIDLVGMAVWIKSQASAGKRVLVVDPITAVSAGGSRWLADETFMMDVKKTLVAHGASLILMTHGTKSNRNGPPTANDTAGGAAYNRFASVSMTIYKSKKPRRCQVRTKTGAEWTGTYGMFAAIHKTRNGRGSGLEVAMQFGKELEFTEQGIVMEDVPEMDERNNDPFA